MPKQKRDRMQYKPDAVKIAEQMKREDYKAIKHMDKVTLANYLSRVWMRGYEAGVEAMEDALKSEDDAEPTQPEA